MYWGKLKIVFLSELINTTSFNFDLYSNHHNINTRSLDFATRVNESLNLVCESINYLLRT